ncbi:PemK-like protein [Photobacterium piscicola]|uniref:PemK-like protein n=1 Tax=Photobacterium piscicola TaxID=1378299 RepID=A0A1T5I6D7_9GAMM|nr:type II toxin-antitoxin system PemK/MazF family toxin [Photobacterium piscicola]SKC34435.1 PemK-like protein [Photobacterium piscicola]
MPLITINYYQLVPSSDEETNQLTHIGTENFLNIKETLIPSINGNSPTITKLFSSSMNNRWKVIAREIITTTNHINITLEAIDCTNDQYLDQTKELKKISLNQILRKGTVIEVEFGSRPDCYSNTNNLQSNKNYPDSNQIKEMHKRRPAIVLNVTKDFVQVVPLTSQEAPGYSRNNSIFEISEESLINCVTLNRKKSYALCHMIQTVSITRILPPKTRGKSYSAIRDTRYREQITRNDLIKLNTAIANSVGIKDYEKLQDEIEQLKIEKSDLLRINSDLLRINSELATLRSENMTLRATMEQTERKNRATIEVIKDQYIRYGLATLSNVYEKIDEEIQEMIDFL